MKHYFTITLRGVKKTNSLSFRFLLYYGLLYCTMGYAHENFEPYYAMVVAPVVEAIGTPAFHMGYEGDPDVFYQQIPLAAVDYRDGSCARIHQLLLHEIVKVEQEEQYEAKVTLCNTYFQVKNDEEKKGTFWILKKNIIPLSELSASISLPLDSCLPTPISHQEEPLLKDCLFIKAQSACRCVTLLNPFHDTVTDQSFSAGTRFVLVDSNVPESAQEYEVYVYDPEKKDFVTIPIPASLALLQRERSHEEVMQLFVRLVRAWAHLEQGIIPWAWGGCSFVHFDPQEDIEERSEELSTRNIRYFIRPGYDHVPKTGFDCSGLVLRAAQIAGLPYYFKNTTTLEKNLKPLAPDQALANGDLIFFPGHVIIVSDVENNLCVEARGYTSGYGKIQEIEISKIFLETKNFDDLVKAYHEGQPLTLLARSGEPHAQVPFVKLLKLTSVWGL